MGFLDLIFPKSCVGCNKIGSYLCTNCAGRIEYLETQICCQCYKPALSGRIHPGCYKQDSLEGVISLVNYKTPIKELIQTLKYRFTTDLLSEFSQKISFSVDREIENWVLLPLPLHSWRENYRGFNQSELLGEAIATKLKLDFDTQILKRKRSTKQQVGLSQKNRSKNMQDAFEVTKSLTGGNYYIFDDVWTSGASLKSAARALKKAGAKSVWGLTLSHPR